MITLPALSIRQPWAYLIAMGYKDIENRSWKTERRGAFLIHAAQKFDDEGYEWVYDNLLKLGLSFLPQPQDFYRGGITGRAEITDCVQKHSSPWFFGEHGFVINNAEPLAFMPCKGRLGFFEVNYEANP